MGKAITLLAYLTIFLIAVGVGHAIRMQQDCFRTLVEPEDTNARFTLEYVGWVNGYGSNVRVIHDNKLNVTCYGIYEGMSCIPDYMLIPEGYNADNI